MKESEKNTDTVNLINCSECNQSLPLDNFNYNEKQYPKIRGYRSYLCFDCTSIRNKKNRERRKQESNFIYDSDAAKLVLIRLGYDIDNPDKPVHVQFQERWGLK